MRVIKTEGETDIDSFRGVGGVKLGLIDAEVVNDACEKRISG